YQWIDMNQCPPMEEGRSGPDRDLSGGGAVRLRRAGKGGGAGAKRGRGSVLASVPRAFWRITFDIATGPMMRNGQNKAGARIRSASTMLKISIITTTSSM